MFLQLAFPRILFFPPTSLLTERAHVQGSFWCYCELMKLIIDEVSPGQSYMFSLFARTKTLGLP